MQRVHELNMKPQYGWKLQTWHNSTCAFESFSHTKICSKKLPTVMCIIHSIAYTGEFSTLTAATTHVPFTLSPQPVANIWLIEGVTFTLGPPIKMADDSSRNSSESRRHSDHDVSAYGNWPGLRKCKIVMTVLESMYGSIYTSSQSTGFQ